jgi:hypothetical protein
MQARPTIVMRPGAAVRGAVAALLSLLLASCMATSLGPEPRGRGTDPSGRWLLDPAASDDAQKQIRASLPAPRAQPSPLPASGAPAPGGGAAGDGSRGQRGSAARDGSSANAARAYDDNSPRLRPTERLQFVRSATVPAEVLVIERDGTALTIVQGDRRRHFELAAEDPPTITDRYGSRRVRAGFSGDALMVESVDGGRVRLEETWRPGPEAGTLISDVTLKAWDFKSIHVRSLYRRAGADAPLPAANDGPTPGAVR